jgi:hypothetical protein
VLEAAAAGPEEKGSEFTRRARSDKALYVFGNDGYVSGLNIEAAIFSERYQSRAATNLICPW